MSPPADETAAQVAYETLNAKPAAKQLEGDGVLTLVAAITETPYTPEEWFAASTAIKSAVPVIMAIEEVGHRAIDDREPSWQAQLLLTCGYQTVTHDINTYGYCSVIGVLASRDLIQSDLVAADEAIEESVPDKPVLLLLGPSGPGGLKCSSSVEWMMTPDGEHARLAADYESGVMLDETCLCAVLPTATLADPLPAFWQSEAVEAPVITYADLYCLRSSNDGSTHIVVLVPNPHRDKDGNVIGCNAKHVTHGHVTSIVEDLGGIDNVLPWSQAVELRNTSDYTQTEEV